ncbi:MAG: bifunctional diguanylate cyclase/phosphodiesterase [Candidatus Devosia phytovorans]|uniref:Bifunctional diguanylate cyclase/phosphodiesterase n=1 Tax=Candidatus Devosia phytovorans TaxID=3121372 RepID=A0AAJ5VTU8_9HYPH|nr:bifunctional diguanylate cyclase/phosphodiesterase [Devosia sp.]WEK04691.1 MAG: bifunctional diguanylate cyclase/phosphodiesterase [Devosia sp.]
MSQKAQLKLIDTTQTWATSPSPQLMALLGQYDHITHLPNRLQFINCFDLLAGCGRPAMLVLVSLADARHYNEMQRALGIAFVENFVRAGARMIGDLLPPGAEIFHVGVLSFVTAVPVDDLTRAPDLVAHVAAAFASSMLVDNIPINTRVGVGLLPLDLSRGPTESLRAALVSAQDSRNGDTGYNFYDHRTDAANLRAFRMLAGLPEALAAEDQLSLHFQPRVRLCDGICTGVEALLRWTHPQLGPIAPGEFIPLVEQTALMAPLTDWVMDKALRQGRLLRNAGYDLKMSINTAPANLSEAGFDDLLLSRLEANDLSPEHVELEFTEGTLAANPKRAVQQLNRLRKTGVEVALDDFGSGYSNLIYLSRIPADVLKIDQSFVRPLMGAEDDDFLLRHIVTMAKGLGFRICAEGIETEYAYGHLASLGVEEGQGYHMARPMPADKLLQWLDSRQHQS